VVSVSNDTVALLEAFAIAVEANSGLPAGPDDRVLDAEGLAIKCFYHGISSLYLQRGTIVPELRASFFDPASMAILARATIESFLVFHYVFAEPQSSQERELRYLAWVLADLMERQGLPATLPESQAKQRQEQREIESIKDKTRRNLEFQKLSKKQQKNLIDNKQWRRKSWTEIARSAGLSQLHAEHAYRYLCSYAHSGSLSVLQVRQAKSREDQVFLAERALRLINVSLAFMISAYSSMFNRAEAALSANAQLRAKVDEWVQLGAEA
jgi:hypothetical protein